MDIFTPKSELYRINRLINSCTCLFHFLVRKYSLESTLTGLSISESYKVLKKNKIMNKEISSFFEDVALLGKWKNFFTDNQKASYESLSKEYKENIKAYKKTLLERNISKIGSENRLLYISDKLKYFNLMHNKVIFLLLNNKHFSTFRELNSVFDASCLPFVDNCFESFFSIIEGDKNNDITNICLKLFELDIPFKLREENEVNGNDLVVLEQKVPLLETLKVLIKDKHNTFATYHFQNVSKLVNMWFVAYCLFFLSQLEELIVTFDKFKKEKLYLECLCKQIEDNTIEIDIETIDSRIDIKNSVSLQVRNLIAYYQILNKLSNPKVVSFTTIRKSYFPS